MNMCQLHLSIAASRDVTEQAPILHPSEFRSGREQNLLCILRLPTFKIRVDMMCYVRHKTKAENIMNHNKFWHDLRIKVTDARRTTPHPKVNLLRLVEIG